MHHKGRETYLRSKGMNAKKLRYCKLYATNLKYKSGEVTWTSPLCLCLFQAYYFESFFTPF